MFLCDVTAWLLRDVTAVVSLKTHGGASALDSQGCGWMEMVDHEGHAIPAMDGDQNTTVGSIETSGDFEGSPLMISRRVREELVA